MKCTNLHTVLITFLFQLTSCINTLCGDCGDPIAFEPIKVKIVNSRGENLIFGPFALYNADSIRIVEFKNNPNSVKGGITRQDADSTLLFRFYSLPGKNYIYYNQQTPSDSVEFKFSTTTIKCCGRKEMSSKIDSVIFNNTAAQAVDRICIFVK